jgi:hypothetical protein
LLSENPERYRDTALQGIHEILQLPAGAPLDACIESVNSRAMRPTFGPSLKAGLAIQ